MSVIRRFLLAPALGRLVRKERGGSRITEGYFAPQGDRTSLVRIDGQNCHLILISAGPGGTAREERTEVPRAHGDALMDVCGGKAVYERTTLGLTPGREAVIDRYVQPAGVDMVSVTFDNEEGGKAFRAPVWFGAEITANEGYDRHAIALKGPPEAARVGLNNAMLDALLDQLEPRYGLGRYAGAAASPARSEPEAARPTPPAPPPAREAAPEAPPPPAAEEPPTEPAFEPTAAAPAAEALPARTEAKLEPKPETDKPDARIDDVIESLSQALGAAIQQPPEGDRQDEFAASFERWQVRPRRTQQ